MLNAKETRSTINKLHHRGSDIRQRIAKRNLEVVEEGIAELAKLDIVTCSKCHKDRVLQAPPKWVYYLVLECAGAIERLPVVQFVQNQFGVSTDEAQRLIDMAREAELMDIDEQIAQAEQALVEYYTDNPTARARSPLKRLFTGSRAEVIDG